MTLTEFLLARIVDDERQNALGPEPENWCDRAEGVHLEHGRFAAECEAKRRIVELHNPLDGGSPEMYPWADDHGNTYWPECAECHEKMIEGRGCETLRALALPYAAHPDYREEWKP